MIAHVPFAALAAVLLTADCATLPAGPAPMPRAVDADVNSWGKPLAAWHVDASGGGWYRRAEQVERGGFHDYRLVTRKLAIGEEGFRALVAILEPAEPFSVRPLDCRREITDQPYGTVAWTYPAGAQALRYDLGCRGAHSDVVYGAIGSAMKHIESLAHDAPVVETKTVGQTDTPQE